MKLFKPIQISVLLLAVLGLAQNTVAASEAPTPVEITMKSPTLFIVEDHEVAIDGLVKALKKHKIPTDLPLAIEIPANIPMAIIKDLTQRLATAGYKPFFKYPRHADAVVKNPNAPVAPPPPPKQKWRK